MPELRNKAGQLTPYALACGYIERGHHVTLSMDSFENKVYFVKGFHPITQKHIYKSFKNLKKARAYAAAINIQKA